ncbi:hypothetical protein [Kibdelosporangium philippinense]
MSAAFREVIALVAPPTRLFSLPVLYRVLALPQRPGLTQIPRDVG